MLRLLWKTAVATASAVAMIASLMLPPEHVHRATFDDEHSTAHRHAAFHLEPAVHNDLLPHVEAPTPDDDAHVVWTAIGAVGSTAHQAHLLAIAVVPALTTALTAAGRTTVCYDTSAHGPPVVPLESRGPPVLLSA